MAMDRYTVAFSDLAGGWKVADEGWALGGTWCALPDPETGRLRQLLFETAEQAGEWLRMCDQAGLDMKYPGLRDRLREINRQSREGCLL